MSTVQQSFTDLVLTLRQLGAALIPATAAQYQPPPRGRKAKESVSESKGISNPTLDTVLDPRRMALSDEVARADLALRSADAKLRPLISALHDAVARWEGQEGTP